MATEPIVYSGFQTGIIYALNAYGRPAGTGLTAYAGLDVYATQVFTLNLPEPRRVPHSGNDRLLKTQIFPSKEAAAGELQIGAEDLALIAVLTGLTVGEIAGMSYLPHLTDLQGHEPNVGMLLYQAGLSRSGPQVYHWHMIPNTTAVVRLPGMGENPEPLRFSIAPNPVTKHLWGMSLGETDIYGNVTSETGALENGILSGYSAGEPLIVSFIADGAEDTFLFSTTKPANDVANVKVFTAFEDTVTEVDGADITIATTGVTFDTPPTNLHEVIVVYQH